MSLTIQFGGKNNLLDSYLKTLDSMNKQKYKQKKYKQKNYKQKNKKYKKDIKTTGLFVALKFFNYVKTVDFKSAFERMKYLKTYYGEEFISQITGKPVFKNFSKRFIMALKIYSTDSKYINRILDSGIQQIISSENEYYYLRMIPYIFENLIQHVGNSFYKKIKEHDNSKFYKSIKRVFNNNVVYKPNNKLQHTYLNIFLDINYAIIDEIEKGFKNEANRSSKPFIVYRGMDTQYIFDENDQVTISAYLSTTYDLDTTAYFTDMKKCCVYRIVVPDKVPYVKMENITEVENEFEILLPRNCTLKLVSKDPIEHVKLTNKHDKTKKYVIDMYDLILYYDEEPKLPNYKKNGELFKLGPKKTKSPKKKPTSPRKSKSPKKTKSPSPRKSKSPSPKKSSSPKKSPSPRKTRSPSPN